jgi:hypothetical protein
LSDDAFDGFGHFLLVISLAEKLEIWMTGK